MASHQMVLILDYGSQYTQLIARRVRECQVYSKVVSGDVSMDRIREFNPRAVILSGGPSSVYDQGAPQLPEGFLDWQGETGVPVLGICYGMQLLAKDLGGKVVPGKVREYGQMEVLGECGSRFKAWMSHGDEVKELPPGFACVSKSAQGVVASMFNDDRKLYALQFHPEVTHTENGMAFIRGFLFDHAGLKADWTMGSVIEEQITRIRGQVGEGNHHVICGLSGGVDSTVAATLVHQAIGDRLHCVFVDHGLLRYRERERVMEMFEKNLHLKVTCVDATDRFARKLEGVADPERKRKIIGTEFIRVFEEEAQKLARDIGHVPEFLVQGTLYPDVIESSPPEWMKSTATGSGFKHSATIKSHHNVGGLPRDLKFTLVEPLRELFKDEVRAMGRELGVPAEFLGRHPFPGPGLAVRIIGDITRERVETLQLVDEIFIQELRKSGLYDQVWQAFAVFLPIKSVGVQGDGRTHDHVVALRAVTSSDGMTANWFHFSGDFLARVSSRICNEVRGVNRVVYDISSKPPATIEWE